MKARYFSHSNSSKLFTAAEHREMMNEINRQLAVAEENLRDDVDALVLNTLHLCYGWGPKWLRQFYENLYVSHKQLSEHYLMEGEEVFIAKKQLKDIGVNIHKWYEEITKSYEESKKST